MLAKLTPVANLINILQAAFYTKLKHTKTLPHFSISL